MAAAEAAMVTLPTVTLGNLDKGVPEGDGLTVAIIGPNRRLNQRVARQVAAHLWRKRSMDTLRWVSHQVPPGVPIDMHQHEPPRALLTRLLGMQRILGAHPRTRDVRPSLMLIVEDYFMKSTDKEARLSAELDAARAQGMAVIVTSQHALPRRDYDALLVTRPTEEGAKGLMKLVLDGHTGQIGKPKELQDFFDNAGLGDDDYLVVQGGDAPVGAQLHVLHHASLPAHGGLAVAIDEKGKPQWRRDAATAALEDASVVAVPGDAAGDAGDASHHHLGDGEEGAADPAQVHTGVEDGMVVVFPDPHADLQVSEALHAK